MDIKKAFLQVDIQEQDRDVTGFLWFKDVDDVRVSEYDVYRLCHVPFGVICSPFLLAGTVKFYLCNSLELQFLCLLVIIYMLAM